MTNELLAWLYAWSEVQTISVWYSWCHYHPVTFCFVKIQIGLTILVLAYPDCPGKEMLNMYQGENIFQIRKGKYIE